MQRTEDAVEARDAAEAMVHSAVGLLAIHFGRLRALEIARGIVDTASITPTERRQFRSRLQEETNALRP